MTTDPHEEEWLDLPELNKRQIDENKYSILQNRIMIAGSCALAISMVVGSHIILKHDVHDCAEATAKHIMGDAYTPVYRDQFKETK